MDWSSIWHGVVSNLLYAVLIFGGGALLAVLRVKWPNYADPVRYGVIGAACVAIILFAFTGRALLSKRPPEVTPDNLEENIRKWADSLGMSVARGSSQIFPAQDIYFALNITMENGTPLMVFRGKEKSGFLQIQCPLTLSPDHLATLQKLTKEEQEAVTQEVLLELAKSKVGFQVMTATGVPMNTPTAPPAVLQQTILLMKGVPITSDMNEASFAQSANEIDAAVTLTRAATALALQRYSREHDVSAKLHVSQQ